MLELLNQNLTITVDTIVVAYLVLFLFFSLFFVFMVGYVFSKLRNKTSIEDTVTAAAYEKSLQLLDNAKRQSLKIYKDSQIRAKKIMDQAYSFKTENQEDFEKHIDKSTKNQLANFDAFLKEELSSFEDSLSKESVNNLKAFSDLSKDLKKEVTSSISGLKETIAKETFESQKLIDKKVTEAYSELQKELTAYKKEQIDKINDRLADLLVEVATKSLGTSFSVSKHQDVILNLLEDAKKRDLLDF